MSPTILVYNVEIPSSPVYNVEIPETCVEKARNPVVHTKDMYQLRWTHLGGKPPRASATRLVW